MNAVDGQSGFNSQTSKMITVTPTLKSQILTTVTISVQLGEMPASQPKSAKRVALRVSERIPTRRLDIQDVYAKHSADELPRREDIGGSSLLSESSDDCVSGRPTEPSSEEVAYK